MRHLESRFPALLFAAGLIALGCGTVLHTGRQRTAVLLYLLWTLAELRVTLRSDPGPASGADRGSMQAYGLSRALVVAAVLLVPATWTTWPAAGVAVMIGGIAMRLTAIGWLGRFYSHKVRTLRGHQVVQDGPYRIVRHPAYTGMIIAHVGFVAVFANLAAVLAVLAMVAAIVHRIRVEERALMTVPGYARYAQNRARLLPAVW